MITRLFGRGRTKAPAGLGDPEGIARDPVLDQQLQRILWAQYRSDRARGIATYDSIAEAGFRCYSEFEEDGIILYLLARVGTATRTVVELCCGDGRTCMAANLIVNHGFQGLLFDGYDVAVDLARRFFAGQRDCALVKPQVVHAWITRDTVNGLIADAGIQGEVDVLSLDMDGVDYHLWKAIDVIRPRICVFETHDIIPSHLSLTVPYSHDFRALDAAGRDSDFRSVSLKAMVGLSREKGYTLVGAHRHGFNVFFVRNDLLGPGVAEVSVDSVHDNPWTKAGQSERWPLVKDMDWLEVSHGD